VCLLCAFLRLQENLGEQMHFNLHHIFVPTCIATCLDDDIILPGVSFILFWRSVLHNFHIDDR